MFLKCLEFSDFRCDTAFDKSVLAFQPQSKIRIREISSGGEFVLVGVGRFELPTFGYHRSRTSSSHTEVVGWLFLGSGARRHTRLDHTPNRGLVIS